MRAFIDFILTGIIWSVLLELAYLSMGRITFMNAVGGNYEIYYMLPIVAFVGVLVWNILGSLNTMLGSLTSRTHKSSVTH